MCVLMRSIGWYLNWIFSTFISKNVVHLLVPSDVDMVGFSKN